MVVLSPEIIIYGGAFDPPHQGHVDCIRAAYERFTSSSISVLPAKIPAGASGSHKVPCASFEDRLELCRKAFLNLMPKDDNRIEVSAVEGLLKGPNYTVNTLRKFTEYHPGKRLALMMGIDQFASFANWRAPTEILKMSDIIVVKRGKDAAIGGMVAALGDALSIEVKWSDTDSEVAVLGEDARQIFFLNVETSSASSAMVRRYIEDREVIPTGWLTKSVSDHVFSNELYLKKG